MRRDDGFTLLEVLVALAIALLAFVVIYRGAGEALHADQAASRTVAALAHAKSRLAALCRGGALAAGVDEGDDGDGFHWSATVTRRASQVLATMNNDETPGPGVVPQRLSLYDVMVRVTDGGGRVVALDTECLGQRGEAEANPP